MCLYSVWRYKSEERLMVYVVTKMVSGRFGGTVDGCCEILTFRIYEL